MFWISEEMTYVVYFVKGVLAALPAAVPSNIIDLLSLLLESPSTPSHNTKSKCKTRGVDQIDRKPPSSVGRVIAVKNNHERQESLRESSFEHPGIGAMGRT